MRLYRSQKLMRPDLQAHVYSGALLGNMRKLKGLCPDGTKMCAVVKANAYGHGIEETVNILKEAEVDFFAVSSVYEAIHISTLVKKQKIFILEAINEFMAPDLIDFCGKRDFHCTISSLEAIKHAAIVLSGSNHVVNLHVNIETGMGRCGVDGEYAEKLIEKIDACENTRLAGVYTHFATADEEDLSYAYEQLANFQEFLDKTKIRQRKDVIVHAANSAATIKIPEAHFDMVRCGISLYGYYSRPMADAPVDLEPVVKLQAPIIRLKKIPKGHAVSYGCSFVTKRDTVIGIIPHGYADGYWRAFSNNAKMIVAGKVVDVVGRVCMDQVLIDVTDVKNVSVGQMATIIDNDRESACSAYALADIAGTICYEILICIHAHVTKIVH
ncbi:MAG: alanine racemase [Planctomycetes bacterium]|nr:alanine racemase [Planctomycetota bacterium]